MKRILLFGILLALVALTSAAGVVDLENKIKTGVLFRFIDLIDWPANSQMAKAPEITIGVFGSNPFGPELAALDGKEIKGRRVRVKEVNSIQELSQYPIVIVGSVGDVRIEAILRELEGKNVLTISEAEDFARRGGVVRFFESRHKVRFEINRDAARKAGLTISSEILKLARIVSS